MNASGAGAMPCLVGSGRKVWRECARRFATIRAAIDRLAVSQDCWVDGLEGWLAGWMLCVTIRWFATGSLGMLRWRRMITPMYHDRR